MRVLLVEDETDLGTAIKQVLVNEKYVVDWVQAWNYLVKPFVMAELLARLRALQWRSPNLSYKTLP